MAIVQDVKTWNPQTTQVIYSYVKPTLENNRYYVCKKYGTTGLTEPTWTDKLGSQIIDNNVTWECVDVIKSNFDINSLLPENNQTQDLYKKFQDMMTWVLSLNEKDLKSINEKYSNFYELEDVFIKELLNETGYGYIADAKVLTAETLATIYSYFKAIHLLKGTRQGLRLVLDLLGYPYIEKTWYETFYEVNTWSKGRTILLGSYVKPTLENDKYYVCNKAGVSDLLEPTWNTSINSITIDGSVEWECINIEYFDKGEPHTANLKIQIPFDSFTSTTLGSLIKFLRFYVYPIVNVEAEIDPFKLLEGNCYGASVGDYVFDINMNFEVESIVSAVLQHLRYIEGIGQDISDNSEYSNNALIIPSESQLTALFRYIYKIQSTPVLDITQYNNNANIIVSIVDLLLFSYRYTENTGTSFNDSGNKNNDSSVITSILNYLRLSNRYTENTGLSVSDSSSNSNLTNFLFSFNNRALLHLLYSEGSGNSFSDSTVNSNTTNLVSTGSIYPKYENIIANYLFNGNILDSSGNNYHASFGGGTTLISGVVNFDDNSTDFLSLPREVLNGRNELTISFWVKLKGLHINPSLPSNFIISGANASQVYHFGLGYLATIDKFIIMINGTQHYFGQDNLLEDLGFHHVCLTRDKQGLITLYIDKDNIFTGVFGNNNLTIDTNGLIVNQLQNGGVGGGFNANQSGNMQLGSLMFHNVCLSQTDINRLYNIGF